eukprot:2227512-Pyramimonas_sp.AAC.1
MPLAIQNRTISSPPIRPRQMTLAHKFTRTAKRGGGREMRRRTAKSLVGTSKGKLDRSQSRGEREEERGGHQSYWHDGLKRRVQLCHCQSFAGGRSPAGLRQDQKEEQPSKGGPKSQR